MSCGCDETPGSEWSDCGDFNGDDAHDDAIIDCANHPEGCAGSIVNDVRLARVVNIQDAPSLRRRREVRAWLLLIAVSLVLVGVVLIIEREV